MASKILKSLNRHPPRQCKARTKNREQCRNNAIPGKAFCFIKSHGAHKTNWGQRFVNLFQNHWLGVSILLLISICGLLFTVYQLYLYYHDKSRESSTGQLSGKIVNDQQSFTINIGGNTVYLDSEKLKTGFNIGELLRVRNNIPIKLYNENNRLMFDIAIHDEDGKLVCSVVRNEWRFNPNGKFDRNYDINAFEIIDSDKIPVFQIQLKDVNQVYIGGYILNNEKYNVFTPHGIILGTDKDNAKAKAKRFFIYPSLDNLGKYNNEDKS